MQNANMHVYQKWLFARLHEDFKSRKRLQVSQFKLAVLQEDTEVVPRGLDHDFVFLHTGRHQADSLHERYPQYVHHQCVGHGDRRI